MDLLNIKKNRINFKYKSQSLVVLLFSMPLISFSAQDNIEAVDDTVQSYLNSNSGDINLRTGKVLPRNVDLIVPGNAGLDIVVSRNYRKNTLTNHGVPHSLANWELELPKISGNVGQADYCNNPSPKSFDIFYDKVDLNYIRRGVLAGEWVGAVKIFTLKDFTYNLTIDITYTPESPEWGKTTDLVFKKFGFRPSKVSENRTYLGLALSIPGEGIKDLLTPIAGGVGAGNKYITTDYWKANCDASGGTFLVTSPSGTKYTFDQSFVSETIYNEEWKRTLSQQSFPIADATENRRRLRHFYPSKIEDKQGNTLLYSYVRDLNGTLHVTKIQTTHEVSDPLYRVVDFTYTQGVRSHSKNDVLHLSSVEANGQIVQYEYTNFGYLDKVIDADGGEWRYTYSLAQFNDRANAHIKSIVNPAGGKIEYTYTTKPANHFGGTDITDAVSVVRTRTTSGFGVVTGATQYNFDTVGQTRIGNTDSLQIITFHTANDSQLGAVLKTQNFQSLQDLSGSVDLTNIDTSIMPLLQETVNTWQILPTIGNTRVRFASVFKFPVAKTTPRVLANSLVTLDGSDYTSTYSNFDEFGSPKTIRETSGNLIDTTNLIYENDKTITLTYKNDTLNWILGLPESSSITGIVGNVTNTFDDLGNILTTNSYGVINKFTYHPDGELATATDPNNVVTEFSNYKRGIAQTEIQAVTSSLALTITRVVNPTGTLQSEKINGKTTFYLYDGMNRVTSIKKPQIGTDEIITTYTYPALGGFKQTVTQGDSNVEKLLNGFGQELTITTAVSATSRIVQSIEYDALNRQSKVNLPVIRDGGPTAIQQNESFTYDALDRVTSVTHSGDGTRISNKYLAGNVIETTNERDLLTTSTFRAFGDPNKKQLMKVVTPEVGVDTVITRDLLDNVKTITQGTKTRTFTYDSRYLLDTIDDPETGITDVNYDDAGNLISRQVATSGITIYSYDDLNRIDFVDYPSTTPDMDYGYYPDGLLKTLIKGNSSWSYVYDDNNNLTQETLLVDANTDFAISYGYDTKDVLSDITYPSGLTFQYKPDFMGRPTQVGRFVRNVSYHANGQVKTLTYGNRAVTAISQNSRLFPESIVTESSAVRLVDKFYRYDGVGNINTIDDKLSPANNLVLGYYNINRYTQLAGATIASYDATGNIKSKISGSNNLVYDYDPINNKLVSVTRNTTPWYSLSYDSYGNVTGNGIDSFVYDDAGQLVSVPSQNTVYEYDGRGMRFLESDGSKSKYSIYANNGLVLYETDPTAVNTREYIYLGSMLIARRDQCPDTDSRPRI